MRKSRYVTLLLAASALAACDQNNAGTDLTQMDGKIFGDTAACAKEADPATCEQAFATAKEEHTKQAPKFATKEECEAAGFQQCETTQTRAPDGSSHSSFMPMMMGFMMGQMLGGRGGMFGGPAGGAPSQQGDFRTPSSPAGAAKPVYSDRSGYLYAGGREPVGRVAPGTTSLGGQSIATRATSRGGFGASGARYSGGGS